MGKERRDAESPPQKPGDSLIFQNGTTGEVIATWSGTVVYENYNGESTIRGTSLDRFVEIEQGRWIEQTDEQRQAFEIARAEHLAQYNEKLRSNFLLAEDYLESTSMSPEIRRALVDRKINYIKSWVKRYSSEIPDREQAEAIGVISGDVLVTARAGSGKTATLVNRALFLMRQCHVPPERILLLAFNKKAALQIREKILAAIDADAFSRVGAIVDAKLAEGKRKRKRLDPVNVAATALDSVVEKANIALPHAMTFHALAYRIVHPTEDILFDEKDGPQAQSRAVQEIIDDWLDSPGRHEQIRDVMLEHFRQDWDAIVRKGFDRDKEAFLEFRRSIVNETLNGEYVKSFGEKVIADFLFEHDVQYKYERNFHWDDLNYKPDFSIFPRRPHDRRSNEARQIIIEYFGLAGDPDYDEMSEEKRKFWRRQSDAQFLEYTAGDFANSGRDGFCAKLKADLETVGIACSRLSEDEIWDRARNRVIDGFSKAVRGFISRCRKLALSVQDLEFLMASHSHGYGTERKFYEVASGIYADYLERLEHAGEEDFDGLILTAIDAVQSGHTKFHSRLGGGDLAALTHISVDEYQDFSELFFRLLSAVRNSNDGVNLFCVGDDWQAINTFAGSDLKFFRDFKAYFPNSSRLSVTKNYRSHMDIVSAGNAVMRGYGVPSQPASDKAGLVLVADLEDFSPTEAESNRYPGDDITPAVLRLLYDSLKAGNETAVLARRNGLPYYFVTRGETRSGGLPAFEHSLRSAFPLEDRHKIEVSTVHSYKGLQKQTVIVVDAVDRSYPLIHPNWVFSRLFGDSLDEVVSGERRLFYVALTRAISDLVIVTDGKKPSKFLEELRERSGIDRLCWNDYEPVPSENQERFVRLMSKPGSAGTFAVKDQIRACGYRWLSGGNRCWSKAVAVKALDLERIKSEPWCDEADTIQLVVEKEDGEILERFEVHRGTWTDLKH